MNLRTEVTILKLEPEGALTVIEGSATDGTIVIIRARVVEPLRVGEQLALTLTAQPPATVGPTMRERMQARIQESASTGGSPQRLAVTLNNLGGTQASTATLGGTQASTATPSSAAPAGNVSAAGRAAAPTSASAPSSAAAPQSQGALGDASSMLLSSILGDSPRSSVHAERNVDDEMDALFGVRRKG